MGALGRRKRRLLGTALAVGLAACTGQIGGPVGPTVTSTGGAQGDASGTATTPDTYLSCDAVSFSCKDGAPLPESALPRLSQAQYRSALRDVLSAIVPAPHFDEVWSAVEGPLAGLPADTLIPNQEQLFASMDQVVSEAHVSTYLAIGQAAGAAISANTERLRAVMGCGSGGAAACVDAFIRRFARLAFRHAPTEDEVSFLTGVYDSDTLDPAALADLVTVVLSAPQFVYRLELGGDAVASQPNTYRLSSHEVVTKLALQLWRTAPSSELLERAAAADLGSDDQYTALVDEMLDDPRTQRSFETFASEWLNPTWVGRIDRLANDPAFRAFAGSDLPSSEWNASAVQELADSLSFHARRGDSLSSWFLSPYSFARSQELADVYHVPVWDGQSEPPRFTESERAGLLTRAALLANSSGGTRPIMKGVFIRERILCQKLGSPPAVEAADLAAASAPPAGASTRETVETITRPAACAGCHSTLINPLGFASENFDALGRLRSSQPLFAPDGSSTGQASVHTESSPNVCAGDDSQVPSVKELATSIVENGNIEACFARQYTRFALGRHEDATNDSCALEAVRAGLAGNGDLLGAMRALLLRPEYRRRFVGDGG